MNLSIFPSFCSFESAHKDIWVDTSSSSAALLPTEEHQRAHNSCCWVFESKNNKSFKKNCRMKCHTFMFFLKDIRLVFNASLHSDFLHVWQLKIIFSHNCFNKIERFFGINFPTLNCFRVWVLYFLSVRVYQGYFF